jgi:hypothetical protein
LGLFIFYRLIKLRDDDQRLRLSIVSFSSS